MKSIVKVPILSLLFGAMGKYRGAYRQPGFMMLFLILFAGQSYGQIALDSAGILAFGQSIVNGSDYIFEGEVVSQTGYYDADSSFIYTENTININRVFKGHEILFCGTVNIITEGGFVGNDALELTHNLEFGLGTKGVFFCVDNTFPYLVPNNSDNSIICKSRYSTPESAISYYSDAFNPPAHGVNVSFTSIQDVYNYIDTADTANLPPHLYCGREPTEILPTTISSSQAQLSQAQVEKRIQEQKEAREPYLEYLERKIQSMGSQNSAPTESVSYQFANPEITGSGQNRYYEFDIMVGSSSPNIYLDNAPIRLKYNSSSFGTNVMANGNVTITPGLDFNNVTYTDPNTTIWDAATDEVAFAMKITPQNQIISRTLLTTTPVVLFHVKLKIASCNTDSDLALVDQQSLWSITYYTNTANYPVFGPGIELYNFIGWGTFQSYPLCQPLIDNFTSDVAAGTNEILTITGKNFGNSRGIGQVWFKSGNDGGASWIKYHKSVDYVSWTENEIKIFVPSYVDTAFLVSQRPTAGSGEFKVQNRWGDNGSSILAGPLNIPFSVRNGHSQSVKTRVDLVDQNGLGGHTFVLDTSVTNNPIIVDLFKRAVHEWVCSTSVNLRIAENDTNINMADNDNVNLVYLDTSFHGVPLMRTLVGGFPCLGPQSTPRRIHKDTDIGISKDLDEFGYTWFMDTTGADIPALQADMYGVMLHEIGHAIGLKHVNNLTDLMYYTSTAGPLPGVLRPGIQINDLNGAIDIRDHSIALTQVNLCGYGTITPGTHEILQLPGCSFTNSVEHVHTNSFQVRTYPNPVKGEDVKIEFTLASETKVQYAVYNTLGQNVIEGLGTQLLSPGVQEITLPEKQLSKGLNIVRLQIESDVQLIKLIKL